MEILAKASDWTTSDEERWASFLDSETGKRLIPKLVELTPPLLERGSRNEILIRSGQVLAFQKVIEALFLLAHPPAPMPSPSTEYPALEDDKAWADGQKLEASSSSSTSTK